MNTVLTIAEIIRKVKIKIDEIAQNDAEFIQLQDNAEMDTIIRDAILEGLRFVCANADLSMIGPDTVLSNQTNADSMTIDSKMVGHLSLPDNYLRLVYAKFSSWVTYVSDLVYWNQENEYAMLHNPYTTGTWERPKVAMVKTPEPSLELYSAKSADDGWVVGIISEPKIFQDDDNQDAVGIPEKLTEAVIYYIAGLVLMTYSEARAKDFFAQAAGLMGGSVQEQ